jgi:hypothetical protein
MFISKGGTGEIIVKLRALLGLFKLFIYRGYAYTAS